VKLGIQSDDRDVRLKVKTPAAAVLSLVAAMLLFCSPAWAQKGSETRLYETRYYRIFTDVDAELARDIAARMDAMFEEYSRRLSAFGTVRETEKYEVHVFTRRIDYMKFVGDRLPNTGGVFIPSRNVLAAYLEDQGRDALRRTLQHEAFHQFAYLKISGELPTWVNEGIAQLFEEGIWTGSRFLVEQVPPRRIRQLQADLNGGRLISFENFVKMDGRTWARNMRDRDKGASQYNQAWAMTHFLVYAEDERGRPLYRARFFNMLDSIHKGAEPFDAFVSSFGKNFKGFESRFSDYARKLLPSREANYVEKLEVLADMSLLLAEEGTRFDSITSLRHHLEKGGYQLHYTKGQLTWSTNVDVGVYFQDLDGRELQPGSLMFAPRARAPVRDLVCRPPASPVEYRARFFSSPEGKLEREIVVGGY